MNELTGDEAARRSRRVEREITARDRQLDNPFGKDLQIAAIRRRGIISATSSSAPRTPHRMLDPTAGPLIAVKLNILTRKTLGGFETDLDGRVLRRDGEPYPGSLRGRRGVRLRRRRRARLPRARGHLPGRLHLLRADRRTSRRQDGDVSRDGRPRICVFGAGSVGCLVGGLLSQTAEVVLIGRPAMAAEIAAHGLILTSWRGTHTRLPPGRLRFATEASAATGADLVLVTVKSGATEEAGRALAAVLDAQTVVISFQNGVRNAARLLELLPRQTVLAGMVPFNIVHRGDGVFHRASEGELMVEEHRALEPFMAAFAAAGLPLAHRRAMAAVQWGKLLLNLNNPVNALSGLPLKEELAERDYRRCLALLQREALGVLAAARITPARLTPLPPAWLPRLLELPDALFASLASRMLAIDPLARSSTYDDLRAGRRTEIDFINGEIVGLARSLATGAGECQDDRAHPRRRGRRREALRRRRPSRQTARIARAIRGDVRSAGMDIELPVW